MVDLGAVGIRQVQPDVYPGDPSEPRGQLLPGHRRRPQLPRIRCPRRSRPRLLAEGCLARGTSGPLCTLDALRYRLPLVLALRRLVDQANQNPLLVDAPGVVRGPAAAELLAAMLEAAQTDRILAIVPESGTGADSAMAVLDTLSARVLLTTPSAPAYRHNKRQRARDRTIRWNQWLSEGAEESLDLTRVRIREDSGRGTIDWQGRQLALLDHRGEACAPG